MRVMGAQIQRKRNRKAGHSPLALKERDVSKQVKDFLEWRGWRPVRFQRTVIPGQFQAGEPGMPDFLMLRYLWPGACGAMRIEFKHPSTGRATAEQVKWHNNERARGALVVQVDDLDTFTRWYEKQFAWIGLGRTYSEEDAFPV